MKEHKRIKGEYAWIPMDKRVGIFGLPMPYRKPELRKPKFWLDRDGGELYFINDSEEVLDFISTSTGGFATFDDDVVTVGNTGYTYKDVMPQEAVKIEEFDGYYDLDFVLQVIIYLKSKNEGDLQISPPAKKGGIGETILIWDTGEVAKAVGITKNFKI